MPHRLLLPLAWLTLLLAAGLMAFHIPLDSDRLYFDALFSDLAAGGRWEDWRLPPAPGHVPDLLLYALAFEWLPTPLWRLHFVSACQALLAGLSALLLLRQVAPRGTRAGAPAVLLALSFSILVSWQTGAWLFINDNNAHAGGAVLALLSAAVLLQGLERPRRWQLGVLFVLACAGPSSTQVYVLNFTAPAALLCLYLARQQPELRRPALRLLAAVAGGFAASVLVCRAVVHNNSLHGRIFRGAGKALRMLGEDLGSLADQPPAGGLLSVFTLACVAGAAWMARRPVPQQRDPAGDGDGHARSLHRLAILAVCSGTATLFGAVLSGGIVDAWGLRYFWLPAGLSIVACLALWTTSRPTSSARVCWLLCAVFLAYAWQLHPPGPAWDASLLEARSRGAGVKAAAACVNSATAQGARLQAGIAQYWFARGLQDQLPGRPPMLAVREDLTPYFWMSTIGPLRRPGHYGWKFDFVVLQPRGATSPHGPGLQRAQPLLPRPSRVFRCAESGVEVWVYEDDGLHRMVLEKSRAALASPA